MPHHAELAAAKGVVFSVGFGVSDQNIFGWQRP
jgi:hypothetical protein